jgi:hypothetical protein
MTEITYTAAVAIASDVVAAGLCDVSVGENDVTGYRLDDAGNEIPEYTMSDRLAMEPMEIAVGVDDNDKLEAAGPAADAQLWAFGWNRTGEWLVTDTAMYAPVERAG